MVRLRVQLSRGASVRLGQSWEQWGDADSHVEELIALMVISGCAGSILRSGQAQTRADCYAEAEDEAVS